MAQLLRLVVAVALVLATAAAPKKKKRREAGPEPPTIPHRESDGLRVRNWQEDLRRWVAECQKSKRHLFLEKGKLVPRKLRDITNMIADTIAEEKSHGSRDASATKLAAKPTDKKLSRKERIKQELMGRIGSHFDAVVKHLPGGTSERDMVHEKVLSQGASVMGQIIQKTKLPPDTEFELAEFCDVMYRQSHTTPLDEKPQEDQEMQTPFSGHSMDAAFDDMDKDTEWWTEDEDKSRTDVSDADL